MFSHYDRIEHTLKHLTSHYGFQICVKDFIGFIHMDKQLDHVLAPYVAHVNPYCMFIKQELGWYTRCLDMMRPMYEKCRTCLEGFSGVCHAGIYEYVVPIHLADGEVLGSINLGYVNGSREVSYKIIRRILRGKDAPTVKTAITLFDKYVYTASISIDEIKPYIWLLADSMAQNYAQFQSSHINHSLSYTRRVSNAETILAQVQSHVQENFASHIVVADLAAICCCSESYINHLFTKHFGVSVSTYINKVRIEHAKYSLLITTNKISTVATDVGFSEPSYFSKVFGNLLGISPSEFRRRYTT